MDMSAATVSALNLVDGAAAARARSADHAFTVSFGDPFAAIFCSHRWNYTDETTVAL